MKRPRTHLNCFSSLVPLEAGIAHDALQTLHDLIMADTADKGPVQEFQRTVTVVQLAEIIHKLEHGKGTDD